ncbi:AraC family transcriptional regulator [Bacteroides sp. 51]|uniref:helix-turn-helix domain-containing protein n=1 Tax=Bacteroides sp. 51 TaxID=2302938 RepID=UPI0013D6CCE2|nr:AraC family transcriptional regulator [Bacteroides sp. 51]NDV80499.1 AraC family transcriptional regulator [Bacteroides sp. 51]
MKVLIYVCVIDDEGFVINDNNKDKQFLCKIGKILEDNYRNSDFNVSRFVELSEMRRTIFFRRVRRATGSSPSELLKKKRLSESVVLLTQDELNISEIAYKVGFDDPYYFSKCFKDYFNYSPTEYRKKLIGNYMIN